jgi:AGCS family alanine or glycine:cation symporter
MNENIDGWINQSFEVIADIAENIIFFSVDTGLETAAGAPIMVPLILLWLASASIFFTLYFGFINFRYFKHSVAVACNKYDEPEADGQISSFQALATSLSGTVGLGNIAGVAVAITVGGPGAALWMVVMGLFSMSTKFIEVTLGVKYRHHNNPRDKSDISGGPMYYLRDALNNRGIPHLGSVLAIFFAVACVAGALGGGNMFQANQALEQFVSVTGGQDSWFAENGWVFGLGFSCMVGLVIIGGLKSIARTASSIVPFMAALYLLAGFVILGINFSAVPDAFMAIVTSAFSLEAGLGGFIGAILAGVQRASFSNEAGLGSSAIIHATARTQYPVRQGIAGMMGSFVDTVIVCTMTALIIVVSGLYQGSDGMAGVALTSAAMADSVSWFPYLLVVCVILFAFSTLITWYYYGEKSLTFICGEKWWVVFAFKIIFCLFVILGAAVDLENVVRFSDALLFAMAIPNIIGLYILAPEIKRDLKTYIRDTYKKS